VGIAPHAERVQRAPRNRALPHFGRLASGAIETLGADSGKRGCGCADHALPPNPTNSTTRSATAGDRQQRAAMTWAAYSVEPIPVTGYWEIAAPIKQAMFGVGAFLGASTLSI
jgi:hypothetical protein